jgi:hypothetical protein
MLTKHQQRMAEIVHQSAAVDTETIARLQSEIHELRSTLMEHTIAIDNLSTRPRLSVPETPQLQDQARA